MALAKTMKPRKNNGRGLARASRNPHRAADHWLSGEPFLKRIRMIVGGSAKKVQKSPHFRENSYVTTLYQIPGGNAAQTSDRIQSLVGESKQY
jgi:hypothetical protein